MVMVAVLLAPMLSLPAYLRLRSAPQVAVPESLQPTVDDMTAQIAALDSEARLHMRIAEEILRLDSASSAASARGRTLPLGVDLTADQFSAAAILVHSADGVEADRNRKPQAIALYQNVVRLFPKAPAAATARQRLRELGNL